MNLKHQEQTIMKQLIFLSILFLTPFLMNAQGDPTTLGNPTGAVGTGGGYTSTYVGTNAGRVVSTPDHRWNTFVGSFAGRYANNNSNTNAFFGASTGVRTSSGKGNTFIGQAAGRENQTGNNNTYIGKYAGYLSKGSGNVFLGRSAGYNENGNNKLYIDNTDTSSPLIHGDCV